MAYVSTWRRDGVDAGWGGAWRHSVDVAELCVIPGCTNLVGAQGDGCADCRLAFGDRVGRPERSGAYCWLCTGPALVDGAACGRCADAVGTTGHLVVESVAGAVRRTG